MALFSDMLSNLNVLFDPVGKDAIWLKGNWIPGRNPNEWRTDAYGNVIRYSEYGLTSLHGWERDHIWPDGPDEPWNLRPLHWRNNRHKSDKDPLMHLIELLLNKK